MKAFISATTTPPTGSRIRVLSHPAHQHRLVKEAELNPERFTFRYTQHDSGHTKSAAQLGSLPQPGLNLVF